MSSTVSSAARAQRASSEGLMKRSYVCVPRVSRFSTYSAPTMASRYDLRLRLSVETNTWPPGFTRSRSARSTLSGSGTCSSISMQVTTS